MERVTFLAFLSLLIAGAVSGCASKSMHYGTTDMAAKSHYNYSAEAQLAEAANSISTSLVHLRRIQQAATPPVRTTLIPDPHSIGMAGIATIDWSGPVEPILHKIGAATNYHVKVLGKEPPIPVIVNVFERNKPLGDILFNIGYQCGTRADIYLNPLTHTIELRYAKI